MQKWAILRRTSGFWRQGDDDSFEIRDTANPMHVYRKVQTGPNKASGGVQEGRSILRYHPPFRVPLMTKGTPQKGSVVWLRTHQTVGGDGLERLLLLLVLVLSIVLFSVANVSREIHASWCWANCAAGHKSSRHVLLGRNHKAMDRDRRKWNKDCNEKSRSCSRVASERKHHRFD